MMSAAEELDLKARLSRIERRMADLAAAQVHFVVLGREAWIRRDQVAHFHWERSGGDAWLVITLLDGSAFRVLHQMPAHDPVDCYVIERELLDGAA